MNPKIVLLCGLCAITAFGADGQLSGPIPGYVFHRDSQAIRPIIGMPGSAYLGDAVAQGFDRASVSPLGISALTVQDGKLSLVRNLDRQTDSTPIDGAISGVSRFAWGSDGLSAAVYSADSRQAQVLRNLDPRDGSKIPTIEDPIDLSFVNGAVSAMAFDGKRLIIGSTASGSGAVQMVSGQSGPTLLATAVNPVALAFDSSRGDLYIADQDNDQIWMVRAYAGDATPMMFADDRAGVSAPVGIRISANGGQLLIANSGRSGVDSLDLSTRASLGHIDLDFTPVRMEGIGTSSLSLLNFGGSDGPLYVLDGGANLAAYFIPAGGNQ